MSQVDYSFVKNAEGSFTFRSTVNSFGIENITEKDINSFYVNFSDKALLDTGLLPVDGTGMLAYRKADNHEQIAYQIKPGKYYINWGAHEHDSSARTYYVAQPYRVIIADLLNGNLLGARTFYSPYPITSPSSQLYHVNLPNINCQGYRGNAVGWICLYHTHDISGLPFNEKVSHILQRCSGVETYNDANMSETDGPRFYASHYSKDSSLQHLWDPQAWEDYSESNGYEWTLDPDIWIPVLVTDLDNQGSHDKEGMPLDIQMALLGNYQAYYSDSLIPKPVNAIVRHGLDYPADKILSMFVKTYADSTEVGHHSSQDVYSKTLEARETTSLAVQSAKIVSCNFCGNDLDVENESCYSLPDKDDSFACDDCFHENYVLIESAGEYFSLENSHLFYDQYIEEWIHEHYIDNNYKKVVCSNCSSAYVVPDLPLMEDSRFYAPRPEAAENENCTNVCISCIQSFPDEKHKCSLCSSIIPDPDSYVVQSFSGQHFCNGCWITSPPIIKNCESYETLTCCCGEEHPFDQMKIYKNEKYSFTSSPSIFTKTQTHTFSQDDGYIIPSGMQPNPDEEDPDSVSYSVIYKEEELFDKIVQSFFLDAPNGNLSHHSIMVKTLFLCPNCSDHVDDVVNKHIEGPHPNWYAPPISLYLFFRTYSEVFDYDKDAFISYLANSNVSFSFSYGITPF